MELCSVADLILIGNGLDDDDPSFGLHCYMQHVLIILDDNSIFTLKTLGIERCVSTFWSEKKYSLRNIFCKRIWKIFWSNTCCQDGFHGDYDLQYCSTNSSKEENAHRETSFKRNLGYYMSIKWECKVINKELSEKKAADLQWTQLVTND